MTFSSRGSGSISVAASNGQAAANSSEADFDMTLSSNLGIGFPQQPGSYVIPNQSQGNIKSFWSPAAAVPGYSSLDGGQENLMESPHLDDQGIRLPSFMRNTIYTSGSHDGFNSSQYSVNERASFPSKDYNIMNNRRATGNDATISPLQPFINHYGTNNQIIASATKKKTSYSGTFSPRVASYDGRTASSETKSSTLSGSNNMAKCYTSEPQHVESNSSDSVEMLEIELSYKTQVNKALYAKLLDLNVDPGDTTNTERYSDSKDTLRIPQNYYQLFRDLTHTLNERNQELEETKSIMEAILVSLAMTKDSTLTTNGTFDAQDLAHKITTKMSVLQSENEALLQMVSHSNKQSLVIELGIVKSENHALREKIKELGAQE